MKGFDTKRLEVRDWTTELADPAGRDRLLRSLCCLLTPNVMAPLPVPLQWDGKSATIENWAAERGNESQVFTVKPTSSDTLLGLLILAEFEDSVKTTAIHLGYLFGEIYWGQGYASELIAGLVAASMDRGKSIRLIGGVAPDNPASARVLTKNGFGEISGQNDESNSMYQLEIRK